MGPGPMDLAGSLGPWTRPGSIQLQYQLQAMSQSSHSTNDRAELPPPEQSRVQSAYIKRVGQGGHAETNVLLLGQATTSWKT